MPNFEITGTDGTKYSVTGPEGSTAEEALAKVKAAHGAPSTKSSKASDVLPPERSLGRAIFEAPGDFASGAMKGIVKSVGGLAQFAADEVGPAGMGDAITRGIKHITGAMDHAATVEPAAPFTGSSPFVTATPNAALDTAGDIVGQLLPYALAPGTGVVRGASVPARFAVEAAKGAAAGAASYQSADKAIDRSSDRLVAGAEGAALGGIGAGFAATANKFLNNKSIEKGLDVVKKYIGDSDPALRGVRADVRKPLDKATATFEQKSLDLARHADAIGPVPLSDMEDHLRAVADKVNDLEKVSESSTHGKLRGILEKIAPEFVEPGEIQTAGGKTAVRVGPGKYHVQGSANPLTGPANKQLLDAYKRKNPLTASYTQLKSASETLDDVIEKGKANPTLRAAASDLRQSINSKLDDFETPGLKAATSKFSKWKEKNYDPLLHDDLKPVFSASGPVERANAVLDIALGDKVPVAEKAAELVGPTGRDAVLRGSLKKAMDAAWDKNSGQIDAVKFAAFFDDKPGLKPFMTASTQKHIDGLKKLFTESALRAGEAPKVSMPGSHSSHPIMAALGIGSVLAGHVGRGMTEIAGAVGAAPAFRLVERLMNDSFGRNLLAAAAVAKPGSPRMGRIMQTVATKFLPIAAGQEGAREAGPQPRQARPGGGLL